MTHLSMTGRGSLVSSGSPRWPVRNLRCQGVEPANVYHYQHKALQAHLDFLDEHTRNARAIENIVEQCGTW